jgi:hypothetical protein
MNEMVMRKGGKIVLSIVEIHEENRKLTKLGLSELIRRIQARNPTVDINDIHQGIKFAEDIQLIELRTEGEETIVILYPLGNSENDE